MTLELDMSFGSKAERMDRWLEEIRRKINASDIALLIELIYSIDIDSLPLSENRLTTREAIQNYLDLRESSGALAGSSDEDDCTAVSGQELRKMLNLEFGVNLDALSNLEGARISIYSKNQWMLRQESDLFIIHTGPGDIDVRIYPTPYFWMSYSEDDLPDDFMQAMLMLGYDYDEGSCSHSYRNPTGDAVPDSFKGRTIQTILQAISSSFSNL